MTSRYLRILAVSGGLFVTAAPAFGFSTDVPPAQLVAQATATKASLEPGRLTQPLTDDAEVLSPAERSEIESAIQQVSQTQGKSVRVVFLRSFGQYTPSEWVDKAVAANGSNTAVVAISPDERQYNVGGGEEWTQSEIDRMNDAAYAQLTTMNWSSAALNAVNAVSAGGSSSGGDGSGAGWLAGGLGVAALAGGGVYAATRKGSKKQQAKQIESAKALDPSDTDSLGRLPTPTLEELARDALVSADDSITQGKQELELATSEFGADRVRPFTSAMNEATTTLQRAFATHQKLYDAIPETEPEKRAMLVDIISSSGRAEQALRDKTTEFNEMRGVLMRAPEEVDKVLARTVDIRARLEPASRTLESLRAQYPAEMLSSINDNVALAAASLDEAASVAHHHPARPAGDLGHLLGVGAARKAGNHVHRVPGLDTTIPSVSPILGYRLAEMLWQVVQPVIVLAGVDDVFSLAQDVAKLRSQTHRPLAPPVRDNLEHHLGKPAHVAHSPASARRTQSQAVAPASAAPVLGPVKPPNDETGLAHASLPRRNSASTRAFRRFAAWTKSRSTSFASAFKARSEASICAC